MTQAFLDANCPTGGSVMYEVRVDLKLGYYHSFEQQRMINGGGEFALQPACTAIWQLCVTLCPRLMALHVGLN